MTAPSPDEVAKATAHLREAQKLMELLAYGETGPDGLLRSDIGNLLESAATGAAPALGTLRRLRKLFSRGPAGLLHCKVTLWQFQFKYDVTHSEKGRRAEARIRERKADLYLSQVFYESVQFFALEMKMKAVDARRAAFEEVQHQAKQQFGEIPERWSKATSDSWLQKRYKQIVQKYQRQGFPPPRLGGGGYLIPSSLSLADAVLKKGGPGKMRTRIQH